jgi:hypothetical protein
VSPNKRASRFELPPTDRSRQASAHAATPLTSARPKSRLREQSRLIHCHRLSRQRDHTRLLPIRYNKRLRRSAFTGANTRASPNLRARPRKGPRSHLSRPKATESSKPSTNRRSCSSPAPQSTGKPAHRAAARPTPKRHLGCRPSPEDRPKTSLAEEAYEGVAPSHPATPKGTRVDSRLARPSSNVGEGDDRRRSAAQCRRGRGRSQRHTCSDSQPPRRYRDRNTHQSFDGRHPKKSTSSTRQFVQRTASHLLTRPQAADSSQTSRKSEDKRPASQASPGRSQVLLTTSASDPSRGSIPDGARQQTGCATRGLLATSPERQVARKPPTARVQRHLPWGSVPFDEISRGDR